MFFFCLFEIHLLGFFFFFQAEDGIRDADVTGVQTCALPISEAAALARRRFQGVGAGLPAAMARARACDQGEARSRRERNRYVRGGVFGIRRHARRADRRRARLAERGESLCDGPNAAAFAGDRRDGRMEAMSDCKSPCEGCDFNSFASIMVPQILYER